MRNDVETEIAAPIAASRGDMILSTHAVVGGAIASLFPSHPVLVAVAAFASHFAIDAIPHWDYPLRAIRSKPGANNRRLLADQKLFLDLALIGCDACAGLLIAIWLFATPATIGCDRARRPRGHDARPPTVRAQGASEAAPDDLATFS
jgi:hypothetical protein